MATKLVMLIYIKRKSDWPKTAVKLEELRNQVWLSKDESGKAAWLMAASGSHVKLLQKLWHFAKELQLNPQDLRHDGCQKTC
jgi:hypothetical protein